MFLFVTYQPNAANNLSIVCKYLLNNNISFFIVTSSFAEKNWTSQINIKKSKILVRNYITDRNVLNILQSNNIKTIITGTNAVSNLEMKFIDLARKRYIQVVSYVDYWNKYKERFVLEKNLIWPDKILVIDEDMRKSYLKLGVPQKNIKVVGSPYFEFLFNTRQKGGKFQLDNKNTIKIIFFSQPIKQYYNQNNYLGYDEFKILDIILEILSNEFKNYNFEVQIKCHPRENKEDMLVFINSKIFSNVRLIISESSSEVLIQISDIILSIISSVLLESIVLRKLCASCQFGGNGRFIFLYSEKGFIPTFYRKREFIKFMEEILSNQYRFDYKKVNFLFKDSINKFIENII